MNIFIIPIVYIYFLNDCSSSSNHHGWGYINLHCRNNENAPVDWWYIYKPPGDVLSFFEAGRDFTFITPASLGRWERSDTYITSNSMLQHTLSPIFRPTYSDYLAVAIYDKPKSAHHVSGSVPRGVLMADEMGGVWIDHTVPGLVNVDDDHPSFPEKESAYGHLIMCLTLDLDVVNTLAHNLRQVYPQLTYLKVPKRIRHLLPGWNFLALPLQRFKFKMGAHVNMSAHRLSETAYAVRKIRLLSVVGTASNSIKSLEFITRARSMRVQVLTRPPGDTKSVYETFARSKGIFLDVYHHSNQICRKTFGVRNIQSLSLKYPGSVYYLNNKTDQIHFAVSTAAHWQTLGSGPRQYWTCVSNLNSEVKLGFSGYLVCVENYTIWLTFDNLKVKEPEC